MKKHNLLFCLLTILILISQTQLTWAAEEQSDPTASTVVLVLPGDDYQSLAEEIAQTEGLPLVQSWEDALSRDPEIILWVAGPGQLSDAVMGRAGLALKQHHSLPVLGIFTGSTLAEARQLWQRGLDIRSQEDFGAQEIFFAANGEHPTDGAPQALLTDFQADPPQTKPMDRVALVEALKQAEYLTFTGHGSDDYLRIDPETRLQVKDLPVLPPGIVSTSSCQTLRLWLEDSIALGFLDRGVAAYVGFVYSPIAGYMIGQHQDLPFRFTWPQFPIGQVVALQTRGTLQGFAAFPFHYLLGDPRISLRNEPPYKIIQDDVTGRVRTLTLKDAPPGLIPVRVPGGSLYRFVEVPGLAATADGDAFFNSKLQAASLGEDKYILVTHTGGDFSLRLHESQPWHWRLTSSLLAAFDHVTLFTPLGGGDMILLVLAVPALLVTGLAGWRRHKKAGVALRPVLLTSSIYGLVMALLLGGYQLLRLPHATISTKPLVFNALWLLAVFLLTASGVGLYLLGRTWWSRLVGLCVAASLALVPAAFNITAMAVMNLLASREINAGFYNLNLGILPAIAGGVWILALWASISALHRVQRVDAS